MAEQHEIGQLVVRVVDEGSRQAVPGGTAAGAGAGVAAARAGGIGAFLKAHPVGVALAAVTAGLVVTARKLDRSLKDMISSFVRERQELARFNASAMLAEQQARIGEIVRNVSRGRVLGPELLSFTQSLESLKNTIAPYTTFVKTIGMRMVTRLLQLVDRVLRWIPTVVNLIMTMSRNIGRSLGINANSLSWLLTATGNQGMIPLLQLFLKDAKKVLTGMAAEIQRIRELMGIDNATDAINAYNQHFITDLEHLTEGATLYTNRGPRELTRSRYPTRSQRRLFPEAP